ncbi:hypothetical protein [Occallatibacter riparius]|uniref:TetR family transcriptional regulator n=1 Tax=Occallatibacter riparius TaxID=1002689 RepID=A0A9J7BNC0_9BACT|nr:hypothetical protein [Occallatibacter riparius]UWZ84388.1 hypothetical protein MOP44_00290 [Occallatibacter riparius]
MARIIQRRGTSDSIVVSSLVVFYRGSERVQALPTLDGTRVYESTLHEGVRTKEGVIQAFLDGRDAVWVGWFQYQINMRSETNTGRGLEIIADVLREWFENSQLRCSALIKGIVSHCDFDGQSPEISSSPKDQLRRCIELSATKMGLHCPELAASAAVLIIERTMATTQATGDLSELKTAQLLLECLQRALSAAFN